MLTTITDQKIPCVYIHVYRIRKNGGLGPHNSLSHGDNRRYFSGLSLTQNQREKCFTWQGKWENLDMILLRKR